MQSAVCLQAALQHPPLSIPWRSLSGSLRNQRMGPAEDMYHLCMLTRGRYGGISPSLGIRGRRPRCQARSDTSIEPNETAYNILCILSRQDDTALLVHDRNSVSIGSELADHHDQVNLAFSRHVLPS